MKQERASGLIQGTQEEKEADMMHPQRVAEKQAALEDMAADAEAAGPFNPVLALAALLGGVVLGFIVNS